MRKTYELDGRKTTMETDDLFVDFMTDYFGGDAHTWEIAQDEGLLSPSDFCGDLEEKFNDYCKNHAEEELE